MVEKDRGKQFKHFVYQLLTTISQYVSRNWRCNVNIEKQKCGNIKIPLKSDN